MKNGIINVYKEAGFTSFDVCAKLRGILKIKRIGHAGTLDPMAEGVLPVCVGRATKLADMIGGNSKEYLATFKLGIKTDTQDITGSTIVEFPFSSSSVLKFDQNGKELTISRDMICAVILSFIGEYEQLTPMYSARKVDGKRLYEYARSGIEVKRSSRTIHIYDIKNIDIDMENAVVSMLVSCSKGTYIRTLCNDIGDKLGCGAAMTSLKRTRVGVFILAEARMLSEIEELVASGEADKVLIAPDVMFSDAPRITLGPEMLKYVYNGNPLRVSNFNMQFNDGEIVRIYSHEGDLVALYKLKNDMLCCEVLFTE